jgi:hypothetical protein
MRNIVLLLLALNMVLAMWYYWRPDDSGIQVAPLSSALPGIHLVKEIEMPMEVPPQNTDNNKIEEQAHKTLCFTLGPFRDEAMANNAKQVLADKVAHLAERNINENEFYRYWVYLPIKGGREVAIERSKSLAAENMKDYYIIQGGEYSNHISLGHFKDKRNAEDRVAKLRKLGFAPELKALYRDYKVYWLDYELQPENDAVVAELIAPYLQEDVAKLARSCDSP